MVQLNSNESKQKQRAMQTSWRRFFFQRKVWCLLDLQESMVVLGNATRLISERSLVNYCMAYQACVEPRAVIPRRPHRPSECCPARVGKEPKHAAHRRPS